MDAELRALLACPDCRGRLVGADERLDCEGCGRRYAVKRSVPQLLPSEGLGPDWEAKQELGAEEYEDQLDDVMAGLARSFGQFAAVDGRILDVGCGIARRPAYLEPAPGRVFVGVDPMLGRNARDFDFVQGVAERLPFRDAAFDGALSATMLDHVPDPGRVLAEIRRVLRPSGRLAVWVGIVDEADLRASALGQLALPDRPPFAASLRRHGVIGLGKRAFRHLVWNRARAAVTTLRLRFDRPRLVAEL
jgi:SAM-dependent methyltransferase